MDYLLSKRKVPERQVQQLALQVLQFLHYLHHTVHVVHRDLKLDNIIIGQENGMALQQILVQCVSAGCRIAFRAERPLCSLLEGPGHFLVKCFHPTAAPEWLCFRAFRDFAGSPYRRQGGGVP